MNTIVRALPHRQAAMRTQNKSAVARQWLQALVLFFAVFMSAIAVVYVKDLYRRLFIQEQNLQTAENQLIVEHDKLLLEQSTWSTQARVQSIAEQRLNMEVPKSSAVVMVQE